MFLFNSNSSKNNYWIFQSNPKNFKLNNKYDDFSVRERKMEIKPNDFIWFRFTGKENGFYGTGRILTYAEAKPNLFGKWTCVYELLYLIDKPLLISELRKDKILGIDKNITGRQYNNQKISYITHSKLMNYCKNRTYKFT